MFKMIPWNQEFSVKKSCHFDTGMDYFWVYFKIMNVNLWLITLKKWVSRPTVFVSLSSLSEMCWSLVASICFSTTSILNLVLALEPRAVECSFQRKGDLMWWIVGFAVVLPKKMYWGDFEKGCELSPMKFHKDAYEKLGVMGKSFFLQKSIWTNLKFSAPFCGKCSVL